jgi:hypothetical protein
VFGIWIFSLCHISELHYVGFNLSCSVERLRRETEGTQTIVEGLPEKSRGILVPSDSFGCVLNV